MSRRHRRPRVARAILAALAVVGVRDWRCYAAVLVWAPAWNAIDTANVSAGLVLLVGVIWRYRATLWPLVAALGLAVSLKLFLWPLLMWTGLFRGVRTAVLAAVSAVAITLVAWAPIRFAGFTDYPRLLSKLADVQAAKSFSFVGSADALGLGTSFGRAATVLVGGALLLGCVRFARERDERRSFTCAVAAAIALTPVLWQHYLVLLVVPVALARPRFSAIWLLPALLWLVPRVPDTGGYVRVGPAARVRTHGRPAPRRATPPGGRGETDMSAPADKVARVPSGPVLPFTSPTLVRFASIAFCGVLPALVLISVFAAAVGDDSVAFDFRVFLSAAHAVLHGESPYPSAGCVRRGHRPELRLSTAHRPRLGAVHRALRASCRADRDGSARGGCARSSLGRRRARLALLRRAAPVAAGDLGDTDRERHARDRPTRRGRMAVPRQLCAGILHCYRCHARGEDLPLAARGVARGDAESGQRRIRSCDRGRAPSRIVGGDRLRWPRGLPVTPAAAAGRGGG